jgi:hypothetical protein
MKPVNLITLMLLTLFTSNCNQAPDKSKSLSDTLRNQSKSTARVSLISLIANPQKFSGQKVRVIGYLHLEFESNGLYLNKDDFKNGISKNAIWIEMGPKHPENSPLSKFIDHYVLMEGTFDDKNQGHMGMMTGSLKDITRLELWPPNVNIVTSK